MQEILLKDNDIKSSKLIPGKTEEMFFNIFTSVLTLSKTYLIIPLKIEDFLVIYSNHKGEEQITLINRSFDPLRDIINIEKQYTELIKFYFENLTIGTMFQNYNEFTKERILNPFETYFDSRLYPKVLKGSKFNVPFLKYLNISTGETVNFNQNEFRGDFSVYIFCKYELISEKFCENLVKIKDCIPQQYKNVFIVMIRKKFDKETFYLNEFKKLFENSPNNNKLVSFFKFLLFDTERTTLTEKNPYKDIDDTQYTYYIIF